VASGPWAPIEVEQRANAFAAYFLMPAEEIRSAVSRLTVPLATVTGIREIAREFGTSPRATLEHLHNLGFLDTFQRNLLRGSSLPNDAFAQDLGTDD
jgi:Zn-dependent peptidase ImmA (M78 family)